MLGWGVEGEGGQTPVKGNEKKNGLKVILPTLPTPYHHEASFYQNTGTCACARTHTHTLQAHTTVSTFQLFLFHTHTLQAHTTVSTFQLFFFFTHTHTLQAHTTVSTFQLFFLFHIHTHTLQAHTTVSTFQLFFFFQSPHLSPIQMRQNAQPSGRSQSAENWDQCMSTK